MPAVLCLRPCVCHGAGVEKHGKIERRGCGEVELSLLMSFLYVIKLSVEKYVPLVHESYVCGHLFNRRHIVARKDYGAVALAQTFDEVGEELSVDRVETAERLVKDDELRTVDDGCYYLNLLLVAFG